MKPEIKMVIDTREQRPYDFEGATTKKLSEGDYSMVGFEDEFAIERKSLPDFIQSISSGRKRFEREIIRAKKKLKFFAILIEASFSDFFQERRFGRMSPKSVTSTFFKWQVKYNIPIQLGISRVWCKSIINQWCEEYIRCKNYFPEVYEVVYGGKTDG